MEAYNKTFLPSYLTRDVILKDVNKMEDERWIIQHAWRNDKHIQILNRKISVRETTWET